MLKKHSSITFKLINHDHQNMNVTENNIITSGKQPFDNIKKRMKNKKSCTVEIVPNYNKL
jgi:hypothetical protein